MTDKLRSLIVVAGPTASGKSAVSVKLAKMLDTEIISADSMQIYKGLDIGTAKITNEEMQGIPHHMIDIVPPDCSYSVNEYSVSAQKIADELCGQGKIPILCGGTGLYINSVIDNFDLTEHKSDPVLREELYKLYDEKGGEYLLDILKEFDPETANTLHPNNYRRIVRAIEFYKVSGITISEQKRITQNAPKKYKTYFFVLTTDRDRLYERINKRVDKMLSDGLLDEVTKLFQSGIPKNATGMQAIGYKEFASVLAGEMSVAEACEDIKRESRRYAKRQLTWFRANKDAVWIDTADFYDNPEKIAEHIYNIVKEGENNG